MKIEEKLLKLSKKAYNKGEVPVACVITYGGKIISSAYNKRHKTKNPLMHAEVIAILKASKKVKDWRLNECDLFVTLYPCDMCYEIIKESRIGKVFYYLESDSNVRKSDKINKIENEYSGKFQILLKNFFKIKR